MKEKFLGYLSYIEEKFLSYFTHIEAVLEIEVLFQILTIIIAITLAYSLKKLVRFFFMRRLDERVEKLESRFFKSSYTYLNEFLLLIFILIALSLGAGVSQQIFEMDFLILLSIQIIFALIGLRIYYLISKNREITTVLGFFLITLLVLNYFNLLAPTVTYLDKYAIDIGTFRLSIYTLLKGALMLSIVFWLASLLSRQSKRYFRNSRSFKPTTKVLITKLFDIAIYSIAFLMGLNVIGVDLTAFALVGGAIGVGIGFGLQKITSNFISGLILVFERSIKVGDMIELEGGILGYIRVLSARYTLVETLNGKEIMIPNEEFIINRVINWTYSSPVGRIELIIGVSYDSDLDLVHDLILEAAKEYPRCLKNPEPRCFLKNFGESSVDFMLHFWLADVTQERNRPESEVLFGIWRKFKAHNIEIPFPQRDIHIKTIPTDAKNALLKPGSKIQATQPV